MNGNQEECPILLGALLSDFATAVCRIAWRCVLCVCVCVCVCACATAAMMKAGRLLCCSDILGCKYLPLGEDMLNEQKDE